jgi:DNA-binding NarL/FixJ family response regulator
MTIHVLLVDDQAWLRLGLRAVLDQQPHIEVVGEAGDGEQAVKMTEAVRPDVVLMDVRMPVMNGIEATRRIVQAGLAARILMLTTFDLDEYVYAALRAGASGFVLKDAVPADLLAAIRAVASGDAVLAPAVTRRLIAAFSPHLPAPGRGTLIEELLSDLTDREREVLMELARAHPNGEIARRLHISEATVKVHVGRVLTKLNLRDRTQAVVFAYEHGIVRPGAD